MKKEPLVSVIIPTYNRKELLQKTINSVINQAYSDWELIIVDDGSTDNTQEMIKENMIKNQRIKYILNNHKKGPGGARNCGIENAKGKFIAFLDSDDIWMNNHLEDATWFFNNSNVDFIFADYMEKDIIEKKVIRKKGMWIEKCLKIPTKEIKTNFLIYKKNIIEEIIKCNFIVTPTVIIRKSKLYIKFDENLFNWQDADFWLRFVKNNSNIGFINKVNCIVNIHNENISIRNKNKINILNVLNNEIKAKRKRFKLVPEHKKIIKINLSKVYFNKGYFYRKTNKFKALYYYLNAIYYNPNTTLLKATKKLFIPGYYKK